MGYHIVTIDSAEAILSCKDGQLTCRADGGQKSLPLEDIGAIIVTSFSAVMHSSLLLESAKLGVAVVICENFKPVSLLLPANRATDTHLTRGQATCPLQLRKRLWEKTLDAKCQNQARVAAAFAPGDGRLERLASWARKKTANRESECARIYWGVYGDAIAPNTGFRRDREAGGINSMLNYGYAVVLSLVLQNLFAVGLDPTFGIHHVTRENSTPLAYDIMEPFRTAVDLKVAAWTRQHGSPDSGISKEFRKHITSVAMDPFPHGDQTAPLRGIIEAVVRSFRTAVKASQSGPYEPWTQTTIRWDG